MRTILKVIIGNHRVRGEDGKGDIFFSSKNIVFMNGLKHVRMYIILSVRYHVRVIVNICRSCGDRIDFSR